MLGFWRRRREPQRWRAVSYNRKLRAIATPGEHACLPNLRSDLRRGRIDRREFLRTATLLGVSVGAAYAMAGLPIPAQAQSELPKSGKLRIGMRVQEIKDPHTISSVEPSNVLRNTVQ
jgi:peptide/nickel transport system substrate-binding protein